MFLKKPGRGHPIPEKETDQKLDREATVIQQKVKWSNSPSIKQKFRALTSALLSSFSGLLYTDPETIELYSFRCRPN